MFLPDAGFFSEIDRKQIQVCAALSIMEEFDVNFLKRSLADRFGIQIYYGKPSKEEYHHIIDILAENEGVKISKEKLHAEATKWEIRHGGVSGRSAKQFVDHIKGMDGSLLSAESPICHFKTG